MSLSHRTAASGSTLIELMIISTVIFIAISAFVSGLCTSQQVQTRTTAQSRVLEQIQRQIENIQYGDWATVNDWNNNDFEVPGVEKQDGENAVGKIMVYPSANGQSSKVGIELKAKWQDLQGNCEMTIWYIHTNRGG